MRIGKVVKIVKIPDAIPVSLPKVKRILVPDWPVRVPEKVEIGRS